MRPYRALYIAAITKTALVAHSDCLFLLLALFLMAAQSGNQPKPCTVLKARPLLVIGPTNWSLNFNPNEISEAIAWAKSKTKAGGEPERNEQKRYSVLHGQCPCSFLWPPCVQFESGGGKRSHQTCLESVSHHQHSRTVCSQEFLLLCHKIWEISLPLAWM